MILVLDIGNTRIKWARVSGRRVFAPGEVAHTDSPQHALRVMAEAQPGDISRLAVTNVGGEALRSAVTAVARDHWGITPQFVTPVSDAHGVRCAYADPARLGADRWVALIAAHRLSRGAACVIDAGTTVTLDAVDTQGRHLGGLIMAGPRVAFAALDRATSGIAETAAVLDVPEGAGLLADTTDAAVAHGAMLSIAGGLDRALRVVSRRLGERPSILITGGDAERLAGWLETETQHRAHLVLEGLALIVAES